MTSRLRGLPVSLALACLALGLGACSGLSSPQTGAAQQVELDGFNYRTEQITASTWTATSLSPRQDSGPQAARLVQAIEKASGCKVTDSSLGPQSALLSAQVDCGSRIKN